jgi:hypothetical protein
MLDTYIKNQGKTKTIIHTNNENKVNEIKWDAEYDGDKANISVDVDENNPEIKKHYEIELSNEDLAEMLNIPSVNVPLEKRLMRDFKNQKNVTKKQRNPMVIEFEMEKPFKVEEQWMPPSLSRKTYPFTHLSSPVTNEEFVIAMPTNKRHKKRTIRHNKRPSYKIYKKTKSSPRTTSSIKTKKYTRRTI